METAKCRVFTNNTCLLRLRQTAAVWKIFYVSDSPLERSLNFPWASPPQLSPLELTSQGCGNVPNLPSAFLQICYHYYVQANLSKVSA